MSEIGEGTPLSLEAPLELGGVNLEKVKADIETSESRLSATKQNVLRKVAPLLVGASLFLAACQEIRPFILAAQEQAPPVVSVMEEQDLERPFPPDYIYTGRDHPYGQEAERIIDGVKKDFGVEMLSPTSWRVEEEIVETLPWETREIAVVAEAISQLPPAYRTSERAPIQILLLKLPESGGAGGAYGQRALLLFIPEDFLPPDKVFDVTETRRLYGTYRNHLRATVIHEYTHSFTEAHPEIFADWVEQVGWVQDSSGEWTNKNPENLIHDGRADETPGEDIAVSAGLMLVNPEVLSEDRLDFFLTNPHYSDWPTVLEYHGR